MSNLVAHINDLNAASAAWVAEDPANRWASMLVTDPEHWAESGVYTVEDLDRYLLIEDIWSMWKDIYGVRPRHLNFRDMSTQDLREEFAELAAQAQADRDRKNAEREAAITRVMNGANVDRDTAIRWLRNAEEFVC